MRMGSPTQGDANGGHIGFFIGFMALSKLQPHVRDGESNAARRMGTYSGGSRRPQLGQLLAPGGGSRQQPPYLRGALEWEGGGLNLNGTVRLYSAFESPDFVGTGRPDTDTAGWEYPYHRPPTAPSL